MKRDYKIEYIKFLFLIFHQKKIYLFFYNI